MTDSFGSAGHPLLNANEFDLGTSAGWDISVMRHNILGSAWSLEGNYFGLDDWDATRGVERSAAGAVVRFIHPIGNVNYPVDVSASYRSALHSVELNGLAAAGRLGIVARRVSATSILNEKSMDIYSTILATPPNPGVFQHRCPQQSQRLSTGLRPPPLVAQSMVAGGLRARRAFTMTTPPTACLITQHAPVR